MCASARINLELRTAHLEQQRRIAAWHLTGAVPATTQPAAPIALLTSGLGTGIHPDLASKPPILPARQSLAGKLSSCAPPADTADAVPAALHPKPDTAAPELTLAGSLALSANVDSTSMTPPQQASAPQQLLQVTEQASSAADKTAGKTPSLNQGVRLCAVKTDADLAWQPFKMRIIGVFCQRTPLDLFLVSAM